MAERDSSPTTPPDENAQAQGFWDRHAKLSILLIAGVFYVVLLGMCVVMFALLWLRA